MVAKTISSAAGKDSELVVETRPRLQAKDLRKTSIFVSMSGASIETIVHSHVLMCDREICENRALVSEANRTS